MCPDRLGTAELTAHSEATLLVLGESPTSRRQGTRPPPNVLGHDETTHDLDPAGSSDSALGGNRRALSEEASLSDVTGDACVIGARATVTHNGPGPWLCRLNGNWYIVHLPMMKETPDDLP